MDYPVPYYNSIFVYICFTCLSMFMNSADTCDVLRNIRQTKNSTVIQHLLCYKYYLFQLCCYSVKLIKSTVESSLFYFRQEAPHSYKIIYINLYNKMQ